MNTDCNQDNARTLSRRIWDTQSHAHCLTGPRPVPFPDSLARFCTELFSQVDADDTLAQTGHLPHQRIARRRGLVLRVEMTRTRSDGRSNDRATLAIHISPSRILDDCCSFRLGCPEYGPEQNNLPLSTIRHG